MHFVYEGYEQSDNKRHFLFRGVEEHSAVAFSIEMDLRLMLQNRLLIQEGPMFCLRLLTTAALAGPSSLDKFHNYQVVGEDFRPLLIEREREEAEKALKKRNMAVRRPLPTSNVHLAPALGKR